MPVIINTFEVVLEPQSSGGAGEAEPEGKPERPPAPRALDIDDILERRSDVASRLRAD